MRRTNATAFISNSATAAKYEWGRVTEEATYKNGKLHGDYKSYFKDSNKIQKFVQFKDGKQDGLFQQFDEYGTLLAKYEYKNGEKVSGGVVK
jgi:antitoxin component YwqK of YwqJK toxin-antitoxin module